MFTDSQKSRNSLREILLAVFSPVIFPAILLAGFIDNTIFAGYFQKRFSDKLERQFANEIRERVPCLFEDFGAQIVANTQPTPRVFDFAVVTLQIDLMLLRFFRGRMDFRVDIAPIDKPGAWREISNVIKNSDYADTGTRKAGYYGLKDFDRFFQSNFDVVCHEVRKPDWRGSVGWLVPVG